MPMEDALTPTTALQGPIVCPAICDPPACACRDGFYRNAAGRCVNANSCPSRCGANEVLNQCGNRCEGKCENVGQARGAGRALFAIASDGYADGPQTAGPCPPNEHYGPCGNFCELTCDDKLNQEHLLPCIEICGAPACVCDDGFLREWRTKSCVLIAKSSCPKWDLAKILFTEMDSEPLPLVLRSVKSQATSGPGIRYCVSDGYPGSSPVLTGLSQPITGFSQPIAPISIPSPTSNPGPFPNFPIPPPGIPAPRNPPAPPSMGALPPGVRPPSPPRMTGNGAAVRPAAPSRPSPSRPLPPPGKLFKITIFLAETVEKYMKGSIVSDTIADN
ncbi:trypsin Inhibitor like cysteine rich domain protein [Teladorsagia circumcincta]|uniref:Trypsin Inhibitor like cysteine rich domain protein n=1 Tax=Teladorsagia circumcincta TaxID=45464 RepID=A0A2G9ULD9_TELCI|nr:trypsin Inhibitor like cysteine rich domain protein [Teladorsagia circumcincta]